jgi:protein-tyrosine phosphatase
MTGQSWEMRFMPLEGCFNFRDLGGYQTVHGQRLRWGRLYRSDALHRLTPAGLESFAELGIVTVIDLRTPVEAAEREWRAPAAWPGRRHHLPLQESLPAWASGGGHPLAAGPGFAADDYRQTLSAGLGTVKAVIDLLARPGSLPAVYHCAAGKDRTGILSGLLLRLLGVPTETVAADYALSDIATARWEESVAAGQPDDTGTVWRHVPPSMLAADRRTMLRFLAGIEREHGSVENFLRSAGVSGAAIRELSSALLE